MDPIIIDVRGASGSVEGAFCGVPLRSPNGLAINLFVPAEWEMCILLGDDALAEAMEAARYEHGFLGQVYRVVWEAGGVGVEWARRVTAVEAAAVQTAHAHVDSMFVDAQARAQGAPAYVPPPDRAEFKAGLGFVHTMAVQSRRDLLDTSATVLALSEELIASGTVDLRRLTNRRDEVRAREAKRFSTLAQVQTDATPDKYVLTPPADLPCAELIPLCKARCCRFHFALSLQDVAEGVVEWDLALPYQARKGADGDCVHACSKTRACTVYSARPAVCRTYDCRKDARVWTDFDARVLAPWDEGGSS